MYILVTAQAQPQKGLAPFRAVIKSTDDLCVIHSHLVERGFDAVVFEQLPDGFDFLCED